MTGSSPDEYRHSGSLRKMTSPSRSVTRERRDLVSSQIGAHGSASDLMPLVAEDNNVLGRAFHDHTDNNTCRR